MFTTESDAHNALDNNQLQFRFGRQYGMGKGKIPVGLIPRKTRRTKPLVKEPVNMEIVMGGKTIIKEGNYNSLCIQWVRRFLEVRCIVRPNRWEYAGDLFAAYNDWAKTSSGHGYNLVLNRQRFGRILRLVFADNKWFYDNVNTPDGRKRVKVGLCLKEHSTMRSPEDLYPSMKKERKPRRRPMEPKPSPHLNPDSADRASETPGATQAENDRLAAELWEKG